MLKLARTPDEAALYMDRVPCRGCGALGFQGKHQLRDFYGRLAAHYEGTCPACGAERAFDFYVPDLPERTDGLCFGTRQPSELFDPATFLSIADEHARKVPADPGALSRESRAAAMAELRIALAAIDAVLAAIPAGADAVPREANKQAGRTIYDAEPGRFSRVRLTAYRDSLRAVRAAYEGPGALH